MSLLKEHITTNLVKVSKPFLSWLLETDWSPRFVQVNGRLYRQKDGIPQGSVLSSLLCSLFYGDMENTRLSFTKDVKSVSASSIYNVCFSMLRGGRKPLQLLMRYVDDFMFVTTKKHLAVRFLQIMHRGKGCVLPLILDDSLTFDSLPGMLIDIEQKGRENLLTLTKFVVICSLSSDMSLSLSTSSYRTCKDRCELSTVRTGRGNTDLIGENDIVQILC